jgi:hypothetical protein
MSNVTASPVAALPAAELPNGAAAAACLAGVVGMLAQGVVVMLTYNSEPMKQLMMKLGVVLPVVGPGANGPYAGHETVFLFSWLLSWVVLHYALRRRNFTGSGWLLLTLGGIAAASLLLWPPVYQALRGGPAPAAPPPATAPPAVN